jgi:hypothetical protein
LSRHPECVVARRLARLVLFGHAAFDHLELDSRCAQQLPPPRRPRRKNYFECHPFPTVADAAGARKPPKKEGPIEAALTVR